MEPKKSRRIVSKGEYARQLMRLLRVGATGAAFWLLSGLCALGGLSLVILIVGSSMYAIQGQMGVQWPFAFCLLALLLATVARVLWLQGLPIINRALSIDLDVPLSRANTVNLPASESLVRGSFETVQAAKNVLLRAAAEGQKTPSEQLVRAENRQE